MTALKIALLAAIAVLLLVVVVDRSRQPAQLGELNRTLQALADASRAQADELKALRQQVAARPVATTPDSGPRTPDLGGDGKPALGVNFLLPYDRSRYHPEWQGGTLRSFASSPKGLNPLLDNSSETSDIHALCNDSLADRPAWAPEQWMSGLAESVVIADDYRTYTFRLRSGVVWQRPACASEEAFAWLRTDTPLTSADFAFALRLIQDPAVDCPQVRTYYEDLEKVETPDERTLILRWKRKVYTSLSSSLGLTPLPRHIYGRNRDGTPIPEAQVGIQFNKHWFDELKGVCGVGAFRLVQYQQDKLLRLERNPGYWGVPSRHVDAIEWILDVKQPDPQLIAFKNGQVQAHGLSPLKYKSEVLDRKEPRFAAVDPANPKAGRTGELGWERSKRLAFSYLGWNQRRPLFADKRVRQALAMAFPKDRIIRDVFYGLGQPICSDVHPDHTAYNRSLVPWPYDPARAKALLAEAGWTDHDGDGLLDRSINGTSTPLTFAIKYYANSPEWDNTLSIFRNELKALGIGLDLQTFEWKEMIRIYEDRDFDAVVGGWGMSFDIDYFQLWHSSQADVPSGSNHCGFKNPRVDELADRLRTTFEPAARNAIIGEIQTILHEEQPYLFFRSAEGIFTWQNRPPGGKVADKDRWLLGVVEGLDQLHPLVNRTPLFWHFQQP